MKRLEWHYIDKSTWGKGPWQTEPDKVQWADKATGLPCLVVRNERQGFLCGYVGVVKNHRYYGVSYQNLGLEVHAGLTFANGCQQGNKEHGICHIVEEGEDDNVWWLGFHCGGTWDLAPRADSLLSGRLRCEDEIYCTIEYVKGQCRKLAKQLV